MAKFMALIRDGEEAQRAYGNATPEEYQRILQAFFNWNEQLQREGRFIAGDSLNSGGATLRKREAQVVVDGPYTETKEAISGYYTISAANLDEATRVAQGCPALAYGSVIEIREIKEFV